MMSWRGERVGMDERRVAQRRASAAIALRRDVGGIVRSKPPAASYSRTIRSMVCVTAGILMVF